MPTNTQPNQTPHTWFDAVPLAEATAIGGGALVILSLLLRWETKDGHIASLNGFETFYGLLLALFLAGLGIYTMYRSFSIVVAMTASGGVFITGVYSLLKSTGVDYISPGVGLLVLFAGGSLLFIGAVFKYQEASRVT